MPYLTQWVPNELFLEYKGIPVFHTYRNDEGIIRTNWFGTASDTSDCDDDTHFDVRQLPTWKSDEESLQDDYSTDDGNRSEDPRRIAIIAAIEAGNLEQYIAAAEDRPKETKDTSPNCFVSISSDDEGWKVTIDCTSSTTLICIPITEGQKDELEEAGISQ